MIKSVRNAGLTTSSFRELSCNLDARARKSKGNYSTKLDKNRPKIFN
jgi:hypothetical protein